jgi:hypothetical protein
MFEQFLRTKFRIFLAQKFMSQELVNVGTKRSGPLKAKVEETLKQRRPSDFNTILPDPTLVSRGKRQITTEKKRKNKQTKINQSKIK